MSKPLISVIVPIYNIEEYLSGCLDSILSQSFSDFEIIGVDDGSTDESGSILEMYAAKDNRIRVVHQKNKGLSGARNTGLDMARGEFIAFCDSDDYYHPDFLKKLYEVITETQADVATCEWIATKSKNTGLFPDLSQFHAKIEIVNNPIEMFLSSKKIRTSACFKLYRHSSLKELRFVERIYFEDVPFTTILMMLVHKVAITNYPLYYYYSNLSSIMRTSFSIQKVQSYGQLIRHIATQTAKLRPDLVPAVRKKVLNGRFKMMVNQAIRKQKNKQERIRLFNAIQELVKPLFAEGIISYDGLKLHHKLTLYLLLHCKTSNPARWVMTIL
ncbi:MAG: glycosyltransferase [Alphaproteobacteria bacterium]|nr:glycosyltransferase [Alphaproteobacteria bacterium]